MGIVIAVNVRAVDNNANLVTVKPQLEWNKTWSDHDCAVFVRVCANNYSEYVTSTIRNSSANSSLYALILNYNNDGGLLWNKTWINGTYSDLEDGAVDGYGFVYVLVNDEPGGHIRKYSDNGTLIWEKPEESNSIGIRYANNSLFCVGSNYSDTTLTKYDLNGTLKWKRVWDGGQYEHLNALTVSSDNKSIYCVGQTGSSPYSPKDTLLLAYDSEGNFLWNRSFGGSLDETGVGIGVDSINNVYICGDTQSYGKGLSDIFLLKYNITGDLLWNRTWGTSYIENAHKLVVYNENIYLAGLNQTFSSTTALLLKYNGNGDLQYVEYWNGEGNSGATGIDINKKGEIFIGAVTSHDGGSTYHVALLKYIEVDVVVAEYTILIVPTVTVLIIFYVVFKHKRRAS